MKKEEIKKIQIVDYLAAKGIIPVSETSEYYVYFSPLRQEKTPSFHVLKKTNYFKDFGDHEKAGDIINLVERMHNVSFYQAMIILSKNKVEETTHLHLPEKTPFSYEEKKITSKKITYRQPITAPHLIETLKKRGISPNIYQNQVNLFERVCLHEKNESYNLAWKNDNDGYDYKNNNEKKDPRYYTDQEKYLTTIDGDNTKLNVFEGFLDYLSALEYYSFPKLKFKTIILNSLVNIPYLHLHIEQAVKVNLFLDNDEQGLKAANKLIERHKNCINRSIEIHPNDKDFNDFLLNKNPIIY